MLQNKKLLVVKIESNRAIAQLDTRRFFFQTFLKNLESLGNLLRNSAVLPKQKLTIGPTSIQHWMPTSDCRRTVEMITMYLVDTTPVSNIISILVANIFLMLAVNISKILVIYFYH